MKAVVWHGEKDVRVETVPDPSIQKDTDIIIKVTSSAICGSDLHLYRVLSPIMEEGDIALLSPSIFPAVTALCVTWDFIHSVRPLR